MYKPILFLNVFIMDFPFFLVSLGFPCIVCVFVSFKSLLVGHKIQLKG